MHADIYMPTSILYAVNMNVYLVLWCSDQLMCNVLYLLQVAPVNPNTPQKNSGFFAKAFEYMFGW